MTLVELAFCDCLLKKKKLLVVVPFEILQGHFGVHCLLTHIQSWCKRAVVNSLVHR